MADYLGDTVINVSLIVSSRIANASFCGSDIVIILAIFGVVDHMITVRHIL